MPATDRPSRVLRHGYRMSCSRPAALRVLTQNPFSSQCLRRPQGRTPCRQIAGRGRCCCPVAPAAPVPWAATGCVATGFPASRFKTIAISRLALAITDTSRRTIPNCKPAEHMTTRLFKASERAHYTAHHRFVKGALGFFGVAGGHRPQRQPRLSALRATIAVPRTPAGFAPHDGSSGSSRRLRSSSILTRGFSSVFVRVVRRAS